jgi:magnesium-protoporphyrin IX monomethyl ester (oxidative) cyclase
MVYVFIEIVIGEYIKMKFLLIKPGEYKNLNNFFLNAPTNSPPLGLLYLGAILEQDGHEVEILDYYMEDISSEQLENSLRSSDAVGMTIYTDELKPSVNISEMIKKIEPNIPLIIGGPHCSFVQKRALKDNQYADISVVGEGEHVIIDIAKYIQGKKKLNEIHGIYYKKNGLIKKGKSIEVIDNLDDLPFPAQSLVDKYDYGDFPFGYKLKKKVTSIETSRGCAFKCRFCTRYNNIIKEWGFRQRSAENVVKEILELDKKFNSILFVDDNFLADNKRAHKIFDMLLENGTDMDMLIEGARVYPADRKLYKKMKKAGVTFITYGIESGNQDVLDFYNKKTTLDQIREAVNLAREMGFFINASFILGAPIETESHIENTIKFACSLPIDIASFSPLGYIIGSQLWREAVEEGKISSDTFIEFADSRKGLGNFTREELIENTYEALRSFYLRPKYILGQIYRSILRNDFNLLINGWKFINFQSNASRK